MSKKRVLIVTQDMSPYLEDSPISEVTQKIPHFLNNNGFELRVLMPRFGVINERRHKLHEVVRLSGMNIIVDDDDYPLIIKVASLPGARMQVYFLDNEEFFKRKEVFIDAEGKPFEDNVDRMVFFCKGVIETVRKFGWPPDVIHCHGWMTSLIPFYIKNAYKNEPLFQQTKILYSVYNNPSVSTLSDRFNAKASINNLQPGDLELFKNGDSTALEVAASQSSDGFLTTGDLSEDLRSALSGVDTPMIDFDGSAEQMPAYLDFINSILE